MFEWIDRLLGDSTAVEKGRENPVVQAAVAESAVVYDQIPLRRFIDEQRRGELARELYLEINRICNTIDPVTVCREELAATMLRFAAYQVLVIPPAPEEDISCLRGQPGISGELRSHLVELVGKDDDLRTTMYAQTESREFDDLWPIVERLYWETCWQLGSVNAARIALGDFVEGADWHKPFLHATCVKLEHSYRWALELPPAFPEEIAREAATAYSVFTDIVLSGAHDPADEWREYCGGTEVPMPDFG